MDADDPGIQGPSLAVGQMIDAGSVSDSSPRQDFVRAKTKINEIFVEIEDYVHDTVTCMQSVQQDESNVKPDDAVQVEGYIANVKAIQSILSRNHMKVVFFGRTSNGKSTVINAMLGKKILPSEYGHTTNCFLQVEGSDTGESYLVTEGSTEEQKVESVEQLANALSNKKLGECQLVHIYWPKDKCLLLRNKVVFIDSPGIGQSDNLDEWIDRYCLDADVFVLVENAESTLNLAEKKFLCKVLKKVSKPNVFILYNRWDVVASKSNFLDQVREQHMERAVEFLVTELKVCTQKEAKERTFFVSAGEALQARLQEQKGLPADNDGFPDTCFEFQDFEEYLLKSGVRKKFEPQSQRGKEIVSEIQKIIDSTYNQAEKLKTQKAEAKKKLECIKQQLSLFPQEMNGKNQKMVEDVKKMVSEALHKEINCLSVLVNEFNLPFDTEQCDLNEYTKKLLHHVEKGLSSKLHESLSIELEKKIKNSEQEVKVRVSVLLPAEMKQDLLIASLQREPFKIVCHVNCENLCADFHVNLLSPSAWARLRNFFGFGGTRANDTASTSTSDPVANTAAALGAAVAIAVAPEIAAVTYVVGESVRNSTNKANEKEVKQQFVAHMTKKQQLIVDSTCTNCSKQVEQELSSTFAQISPLVDEATNDMDAEIKTLDKEIEQLEKVTNSARVLQNKANNITEELEKFDEEFLKLHN